MTYIHLLPLWVDENPGAQRSEVTGPASMQLLKWQLWAEGSRTPKPAVVSLHQLLEYCLERY